MLLLYRLFLAMMAGGFVGVHMLKTGSPEKTATYSAGLVFVILFLLLTL